MREEQGGGVRRLDFFPIHQRRLMLRQGRGFFTVGDIEEIGCDTEHEETQSARCQRIASRE